MLLSFKVAANAGENEEIYKLALLTNFLTHKTHSFAAEAATYDEAKIAFTRAYHKQKSVVFARHLLTSKTQRPGESIAECVHFLRELARDCDFIQVKAEQYRDELTRDVFINGLASSSIRQSLREVDDMDFKTAIERAETLDRGQHHSVFYSATAQKNKIRNLTHCVHSLLLWLVLQHGKSVYANAIFMVMLFTQVSENNAQKKISAVINAEK